MQNINLVYILRSQSSVSNVISRLYPEYRPLKIEYFGKKLKDHLIYFKSIGNLTLKKREAMP